MTGARVAVEEQVRSIWKRLLSCDEVPADANFFELGGRSREFVMVAFAIEEDFDIELSLRDLLTVPTPAGLTDLIVERIAAP